MHQSYNGQDRRRYLRIPEKDLLSHEPLLVRAADAEGVHKKRAITRDLSRGGILFHAEAPFPMGTYMRLQFYVHDWERHKLAFYREQDLERGPFTVIGKVVRIEVLGSMRFDIGVEFVAVDEAHKRALRDYLKKIRPDA